MTTEVNFTMNSLVDDDVFSDAIDYELYRNIFSLKIFVYFTVILQITMVLISALALASDVYLIVIISKFKNLQNRINHFIRLYAIFNILYIVLTNLIGIIVIGNSYVVYCSIDNLDHLIITLCYYVLTFTALDWYMLNYHPNIYMRFPKTFKYGAYILFALAIPKWITTSTVCFINHWHQDKIRLHLEVISFLLCFITIICITVLKHGKIMSSEARKTEYAFIVPRTVLLLSLFLFIVKFVLLFLSNYTVFLIRYTLHDIGIGLFIAAPIVILYQLTKLNKNFKSAFIKSCKKRRIRNYDDDNLDADSENDAPLSNVTFDKNSETINM